MIDHSLEYSLELVTGETIDVLEIESDDLSSISDPVMDLITVMPRQVLEEAKIGYTRPFERLLRTPPVGALIRLDARCDQMSTCPMRNAAACVTSHKKLPDCWTGDGVRDAEVVRAWKDGRYVILVSS